MAIELDNIYRAGVLDQRTFLNAKMILNREHEYEERQEREKKADKS